jgi:hypothetical protein
MKFKFLHVLTLATLLAGASAGVASAAGTASLYLSPASGSHVQGSSFTVAVHENGTNVNVVTAKLTYDASKLSCTGIGGSSAFPQTISASCSGGSITISRYTNPGAPAVSGDAVVGSVNFTAIATGTTSVSFAAGSQIASGGVNIWNGVTTGGTYTLTAPVQSTPTPVPGTPTPSSPTATGGGKTNSSTPTPSSSPAVAGVATSQTPAATSSDEDQIDAQNAGKDSKTLATSGHKSKTSTIVLSALGVLLLLAGAGFYGAKRFRKPSTKA